MTDRPTQVAQASGVRRARTYVPVQRVHQASDDYPIGCSAYQASIHDARYYRGILSNAGNFAGAIKCDIYTMQHEQAEWRRNLDSAETLKYLKESEQKDTGVYRVLFCTIKNAPDTSFGCQIALESTVLAALLQRFQISPQYLSLLLGEPDYWAPGDFASLDTKGNIDRIEFFAQQPRWNIHKRDAPWSIYMTHSLATNSTTYLIVCSKEQSSNDVVKERLEDLFRPPPKHLGPKTTILLPDPFLLHLIITHEAFLEAKTFITKARYKLYDALDSVDKFAQQSSSERSKEVLERLTIELHVVSQDIDGMFAATDMTAMIVRRLSQSHQRYAASVQSPHKKDAITRSTDAISYLSTSIESQMRWLNSYKARKDIAMNLVFNLVTQQDASTSTTIAREAKADGNSMKVIAALTMVFLPGTFLSSVFGMAALNNAHWWLYVALTLPLTILVLLAWWLWVTLEHNFLSTVWRMASARREKNDSTAGVKIV